MTLDLAGMTEVITTCLSLLLPDFCFPPACQPLHASSPSPALKCYMLSITGRHQSTLGAYTPDYCRYRFLNRKIYTLNITVNTGKSIGMSEHLLPEPASPILQGCFIPVHLMLQLILDVLMAQNDFCCHNHLGHQQTAAQ